MSPVVIGDVDSLLEAMGRWASKPCGHILVATKPKTYCGIHASQLKGPAVRPDFWEQATCKVCRSAYKYRNRKLSTAESEE